MEHGTAGASSGGLARSVPAGMRRPPSDLRPTAPRVPSSAHAHGDKWDEHGGSSLPVPALRPPTADLSAAPPRRRPSTPHPPFVPSAAAHGLRMHETA